MKLEEWVDVELAEVVRRHLNYNQQSVTAFAREHHIDKQTVFNLVRDHKWISLQSILKIGVALNVPVFTVTGCDTDTLYFVGLQHAECSRWLNDRETVDVGSRRASDLNLAEPMAVMKVAA